MPSKSKFTNYTYKLKENARSLRREMTRHEKYLWYDFLHSYPIKFYKQRPICGYIVDFYCSRARLIIELDGSQHYTEEGLEYDEIRSDILRENDLSVLRLTNPQIDENFKEVCTMIDDRVKKRLDNADKNIDKKPI